MREGKDDEVEGHRGLDGKRRLGQKKKSSALRRSLLARNDGQPLNRKDVNLSGRGIRMNSV